MTISQGATGTLPDVLPLVVGGHRIGPVLEGAHVKVGAGFARDSGTLGIEVAVGAQRQAVVEASGRLRALLCGRRLGTKLR